MTLHPAKSNVPGLQLRGEVGCGHGCRWMGRRWPNALRADVSPGLRSLSVETVLRRNRSSLAQNKQASEARKKEVESSFEIRCHTARSFRSTVHISLRPAWASCSNRQFGE